jgi:glycogen debranching enzyme
MARSESNAPRAVYLLPLTDTGAPDVPGEYIYLPPPTNPPYSIRFVIDGASSICRHGSLHVNVPEYGQCFNRQKYHEYPLHPVFNRGLTIDIPIHCAGAFAFYTTYTPLPDFSIFLGEPPCIEPTKSATYYIDICPSLTLNDKLLPLDSLSVFSIIPKFMGRYPDDWDKHLQGIGRRNYNMIHFTPVSERGNSDSPYSIYDQFTFDPLSFPNGEKDIAHMISKMEKDYGLLGLTDVVWNHTANNSKWLEQHPEAGYNLVTAPHLEPALELDNALMQYGRDLGSLGLPTSIGTMDDLQRCVDEIKEHVLRRIRLWEYYIVDVGSNARAAVEAWAAGNIPSQQTGFSDSAIGGLEGVKSWSLEQRAGFLLANRFSGAGQMGGRFARRTNPKVGAALLTAIHGRYDSEKHGAPDRGITLSTMSKTLDELNLQFYREYDADVAMILQQVKDRVRYLRVDENGPRQGTVTAKHPFVESYFITLPKNKTTECHSSRNLSLVCNGWVWAADAMKDNAGPDSRAYLRREVIIWSDCVKLRYGKSPEENPFLWDLMTRYSQLMAKYFAGFRIDNCHSTPLHVAEYLLDKAREVRPNLAVFAELFTGDEKMDYVFVKRLGLSALIREAMQSWSTAETSRLVHMHGGRPIGSFELDKTSGGESVYNAVPQTNGVNGVSAPKAEIIHSIRQSPVHALFMDCSHDNEVPAQKRDARDTLPNAALVSMCASATGSVMGYDEIYPLHIEIVNEKRLYDSPYSGGDVLEKGGKGGVGGIKAILNEIHTMMGQEGYDETFVHHEGEYITIHRLHPQSRKGYFLAAHTAFPGYGDGHGTLTPVHLAETKAKLLGCWKLEVDVSDATKAIIAEDQKLLRGLPSTASDISNVGIEQKPDETVLTMPNEFPPGSIALFETWIPGVEHSEGLDSFATGGAEEAFGSLSMVDLNFVLYRCEPEEHDLMGGDDGVYNIPGHGTLVYAGLQGWWSVLNDVIRNNDLGHPICKHLRQGRWALDWIVSRLQRMSKRTGHSALQKPAIWFTARFEAIGKVPNFLLPRYFALVIQTAYEAAWQHGIFLMSDIIKHGQGFLQSLAMVSIQQTGYMNSASLWPKKSVPCLAAGLPHFSSDWARCWGRDVFISLRGLYLVTGRWQDAKEHIIAFASVLKYGMIPNLLSGGKLPRYNSRDSIWFFLQCIQDYTKMIPEGVDILKAKVLRRFLRYDDTYLDYDDPRAYSKESSIEEIIQEAMQRHATGLSFREANAGPALDMQMKSEGFNIDIHVDWETGLIFGGNQNNCGTWMDKMGESDKAGSKGIPGTPRDGAAIEITGLLYSTLVWLADLHKTGKYSFSGVKTSQGSNITWQDWSSLISTNFERCYYIPLDPKNDSLYDLNSAIVNRRGIYKDLYRSGKEYEDYQLRPNFPVAMTVAPTLFDPTNALNALSLADSVLRGPTGMATLDPSDLKYRPYYNNSEDSADFATAKGRNYHQGPEWLWPTGFFLRALLKFDLMRRETKEERVEAMMQIMRRLEGCKKAIQESPWRGLTELTNRNGEYCGDSVCPNLYYLRIWEKEGYVGNRQSIGTRANNWQSPTQAWSAACIIDLFYDAKELSIE